MTAYKRYDQDKAATALRELVQTAAIMAKHDLIRTNNERDVWFDIAHAHCELSELFNNLKKRGYKPSQGPSVGDDIEVIRELADSHNLLMVIAAQLDVPWHRVIEESQVKFNMKMMERSERLETCGCVGIALNTVDGKNSGCEQCGWTSFKVVKRE